MRNSHIQSIISHQFGILAGGEIVTLFQLSNVNGMSVHILNYGGILQSIMMPDRNGVAADIVLGFDTLEDYVADTASHGAIVGRYANRIAEARFELDGQAYQLDKNDGEHCLHGGNSGFNKVLFDSEIVTADTQEILRLRHVSPNGYQGFPGQLELGVDYSLNDDNELIIRFLATSDTTTVLNLTMHPYFNLSGDSETSPLDHLLEIHSTQFLPVSTTKIPIGELRKVENSPFDFRKSHKVGSQIEAADEQLEITGGYDHCSVGDDTSSRNRVSAILWDSASGRELGGESNAPGIQLYTGNHLSRATKGKEDRTFVKHGTVCLEPQHIPNAPNEPAFPSALLSIGEQYEHQIAYRFSIRD